MGIDFVHCELIRLLDHWHLLLLQSQMSDREEKLQQDGGKLF